MKLVKIGTGGNVFECGQETVMFRHEEKFHHGTGIGAKISAALSDDEAIAKIEAANNANVERVGQQIGVTFVAIEVDGKAERAKMAVEKSRLPIILLGSNTADIKTAADMAAAKKPLIGIADSGNVEEMAAIAAGAKCPLAVGGKNLEEVAENTVKAKSKGVEEMIITFSGEKTGETIRNLTIARRAALKKAFRALGYPAMVDVKAESPEMACIMASSFAAKYASIVLMDDIQAWSWLPIATTVQMIYTDPQKPNTVESKLYEVGSCDENSPVMYTTNFSLTYFSVAGEVERSKVPCYISVVDTEGLGLLNAFAGDKIDAAKVVKTLNEHGVANKVNHRKLIIPGLLPVFRAEIEDTSDWKEVIIGPETASKIPAFLAENWK